MPRIRTYGLDIDTIRYAQRVKSGSGTTILPEPLKQINKFVVGVKKLGLWNSMVCWLERSIHNAGTGSTVYSLGGRGVLNGSILNSATWDYRGINLNGINQRISLPNNVFGTGTSSTTIFSIFKVNTTVGAFSWAHSTGNGNANNNHYGVRVESTVARSYVTFSSVGYSSILSNQWNCILNGNDSTLGYGGRNGAEFLSFTPGVTLQKSGDNTGIGAYFNPVVQHLNGAHSCLIAFNISPTPVINELVYKLYRQTVGQDLNLP